jgi:cytoskeletal protein CcmA (bactofilin family)
MALLRREDVEPRDPRDWHETRRTIANAEADALLGPGSRFEGKLDFDGTARIEGAFKGEIKSTGRLVVGESGVIDGEVDVGTAVVAGTVSGTLRARTLVELRVTARVSASVTTGALVIERGAHLDGAVVTLPP